PTPTPTPVPKSVKAADAAGAVRDCIAKEAGAEFAGQLEINPDGTLDLDPSILPTAEQMAGIMKCAADIARR
ncbi:MAG: hypothetical protein HY678_05550, partial [Chloroflexi bacterium]|nr:hypothetical protein [Chloroflexota bacterium]